MHHTIVKIFASFSFAIVCLFFIPKVDLYAEDNAGVFLDYLDHLYVMNLLNDPSGNLKKLVLYLDLLPPSEREEVLNKLQPSWYATLDWSVENSLANARKIISDNLLLRVREYRCSSICDLYGSGGICYRNLWIAAIGGHLEQDKLQQLPEFRTNDWGFIGGFDFVLADWLTVGLAGGLTHSDLKWNGLDGNNSIYNFYIGPYAALSCGRWTLDASILKGAQQFRTHRHLKFAFINREAKFTHYGDSILGHAGLIWNYNCWSYYNFTPYLTADYIYVHQNSLKDKHAVDLDLVVKRHNTEFFQGEVGLAFSGTYKCTSAIVAPTIKVGFQNITPTTGTKLHAHLKHQPGHFTIETTKDPIYQWTTGLFLNLYVLDCADLSLSYNGAWGNNRREYCFTGELDWSF